MSYEIDPLILYSQDRTRMLNFLSDVFEFEVNEEDFLVFHQNLSFKVLNLITNQHNQFNDSRVVFSFRLKTSEEFEEIISKYNFFKYRRGESLTENIELFEDENCKVLTIKDIDSRPWRFELKKALV